MQHVQNRLQNSTLHLDLSISILWLNHGNIAFVDLHLDARMSLGSGCAVRSPSRCCPPWGERQLRSWWAGCSSRGSTPRAAPSGPVTGRGGCPRHWGPTGPPTPHQPGTASHAPTSIQSSTSHRHRANIIASHTHTHTHTERVLLSCKIMCTSTPTVLFCPETANTTYRNISPHTHIHTHTHNSWLHSLEWTGGVDHL